MFQPKRIQPINTIHSCYSLGEEKKKSTQLKNVCTKKKKNK